MSTNGDRNSPDPSLAKEQRRLRRAQLVQQIRAMGGYVPDAKGDDVTEFELDFLSRAIAWEQAPTSTHRVWLARQGLVFEPPGQRGGDALTRELWRLIQALARARVFLCHTNHLSDADLYARLWCDVMEEDAPDFARTPNDVCHCDLAEAGGTDEQAWLAFYASEDDREEWRDAFPEVMLPERRRAPHRRDHLLPAPG